MVFSEDFKTIESGRCLAKDAEGEVMDEHIFGEQLIYTIKPRAAVLED